MNVAILAFPLYVLLMLLELAYERVSTHWSSGEPLHVIGDHGFYRVN